jgi:hypothetical protein
LTRATACNSLAFKRIRTPASDHVGRAATTGSEPDGRWRPGRPPVIQVRSVGPGHRQPPSLHDGLTIASPSRHLNHHRKVTANEHPSNRKHKEAPTTFSASNHPHFVKTTNLGPAPQQQRGLEQQHEKRARHGRVLQPSEGPASALIATSNIAWARRQQLQQAEADGRSLAKDNQSEAQPHRGIHSASVNAQADDRQRRRVTKHQRRRWCTALRSRAAATERCP